MEDYEEDQRNEIEALESIYPDEFSIISDKKPFSFKIHLEASSKRTEDFPEISVLVDLQFTIVENYPDDVPLVEILLHTGLRDEDVQEFEEKIAKETEENLGMVMVFTLVSSAQEQIEEFIANTKKRILKEKKRLEEEEHERERQKFTGTPTTLENFLVWRERFNTEMARCSNRSKNVVLIQKSKITGRKLFEENDQMILSDAAFIDSTDVDVEVDETLFQGLEDLDLEDEELED